jgi:hypothetical protein
MFVVSGSYNLSEWGCEYTDDWGRKRVESVLGALYSVHASASVYKTCLYISLPPPEMGTTNTT